MDIRGSPPNCHSTFKAHAPKLILSMSLTETAPNIPRGGSRGRVQGVCSPPLPEMTCGFLIQLVFCEKQKLCGLLVLK